MTTLGPLLAMFKVRDPVLASRNAKEAKLLKERWERYKDSVEGNPVDIQYFSIFFPSKEEAPAFYDKQGRYQPPLSWRLTDKEKKAIEEGWHAIKVGKSKTVQKIQQLWHETWKMPVPTDHVAED